MKNLKFKMEPFLFIMLLLSINASAKPRCDTAHIEICARELIQGSIDSGELVAHWENGNYINGNLVIEHSNKQYYYTVKNSQGFNWPNYKVDNFGLSGVITSLQREPDTTYYYGGSWHGITKPMAIPSTPIMNIPNPKPIVAPGKTPTLIPNMVPTKNPVLVPGQIPTLVPGKTPNPKPVLVPGQIPTLVPGKTPNPKPVLVPGQIPTLVPGKTPNPKPVLVPGQIPTLVPGKTPSPKPVLVPGKMPNLVPGKTPNPKPILVPPKTTQNIPILVSHVKGTGTKYSKIIVKNPHKQVTLNYNDKHKSIVSNKKSVTSKKVKTKQTVSLQIADLHYKNTSKIDASNVNKHLISTVPGNNTKQNHHAILVDHDNKVWKCKVSGLGYRNMKSNDKKELTVGHTETMHFRNSTFTHISNNISINNNCLISVSK